MIRHTVPTGVPAMPLSKYLRRAWPLAPGRVFREIEKRRDVRVNGAKSDSSVEIRGGDELTIYGDAAWFEPMPEILWTDGRLIVAIKPQGLPVDVDQSGIGADTLLTRLKRVYPAASLCHRLDAATGGIVLSAADEDTGRQAIEAFRAHGVQKRYRALALHPFERGEGTLKAWLQKNARAANVRVLHRPEGGAKPIETRYAVKGEVAPGIFEVQLWPITGRTHQLRAHMADFGHPLLGDDKYGDRAVNKSYSRAPLCLWHEQLTVSEDSPLQEYRGMCFYKAPPDWERFLG